MGLLLIVLPWSTFWDRNYFASSWPLVQLLVANNFVRGAVSGLGIVNLVAGFAELAPLFSARESPPVSDDGRRGAPVGPYPGNPDAQVDR